MIPAALTSRKPRTMGVAAIISGVLILAALIALPYVASKFFVGVATLILASAILASSINMLAGDAGLVSLGHAGISMTAGYGVAWATKEDLPLGAQLAIALAVTLGLTAVFGLATMRMSGVYYLMVTVALGMICWGIAHKWSAVTGGDNGLSGVAPPEPLQAYWVYYFFVLVVFLLVTTALAVVSRSPLGLALRGLRDSESRMRSLGYSVSRLRFVAMMLSGPVAGLAGVLLAWRAEFISPRSGDFIASALPLVMVVVGGIGTMLGPLVGATIVILFSHVLSSYFDRWQTLLGLLFIAVVITAPGGLVRGVRRVFVRRSDGVDPTRPPVAASSDTSPAN